MPAYIIEKEQDLLPEEFPHTQITNDGRIVVDECRSVDIATKKLREKYTEYEDVLLVCSKGDLKTL